MAGVWTHHAFVDLYGRPLQTGVHIDKAEVAETGGLFAGISELVSGVSRTAKGALAAASGAAVPLRALAAKVGLQTDHAWEPTTLYHAAQPKQLAPAVRALCADALRCVVACSHTLELPQHCRLLHGGFGGGPTKASTETHRRPRRAST